MEEETKIFDLNNDEIYTTKDVARILRVTPFHVSALGRKGIIRGYKEGRKGGYRFLRSDVEKYVINKYRDAM